MGGWRRLPSARYRAAPPRLIPQGGIADTRGGQKERERKFSSRSVGTVYIRGKLSHVRHYKLIHTSFFKATILILSFTIQEKQKSVQKILYQLMKSSFDDIVIYSFY